LHIIAGVCPALVFLFYPVGAGTTVRVLKRREGFTLFARVFSLVSKRS
jgi:hypothetical protein